MVRRGTWGLAYLAPLLLGGCEAATLGLAPPELALSAPEVLDLGPVPADEPVEATFEVENVGTGALSLSAAVPGTIPSPSGVDLRGALDPVDLGPGGRATVRVRLLADRAPIDDVLGSLRFEVAGFSPEDPRLPQVEVRGRVSPSGLVAEPNPLSIGPVPYLVIETATLALVNLRAEPLAVYAMRHEGGRALYDEALTRGSFGPLPEVEPDGRLTALGPGERFEVRVAYTAPNGPGEAKEQAVWRVTTCPDDPEACALSVIVQGIPDVEGPVARVVPGSGVHFGPTPVGARFERPLAISNQGLRPLVVEDLRLRGSPAMTLQMEGGTLEPGRDLRGVVIYRPTGTELHNAKLSFRSNDPLKREVQLRVTGAGVVLPPCRFRASPGSLDFGPVEVLGAEVREVVLRNVGDEACVVFDPHITLAPRTNEGTFTFPESPPSSSRLDPDDTITYRVRFSPLSPGIKEGTLTVRTSEDEAIDVPLRGGSAGDGLFCSSAQNTQVGRAISLNASLTGGLEAQRYRWEVIRAPMGAPAPRVEPGLDAGPSIQVTPLALGAYVLRAEVEASTGQTFDCDIEVRAESTGLQATLTWDGPGDLDLHLHRGTRSPWYTEDDCHFDNMRPEWVPMISAANPQLDRDDTSGEGPENIRIDAPEMGVEYRLAVSHFERAAGRRARVVVSCGRAESVLDLSSRPFRGGETGNCSRNDFWTVARLVFFAPDQCTVELLDTYRTTRAACVEL